MLASPFLRQFCQRIFHHILRLGKKWLAHANLDAFRCLKIYQVHQHLNLLYKGIFQNFNVKIQCLPVSFVIYSLSFFNDFLLFFKVRLFSCLGCLTNLELHLAQAIFLCFTQD